MVTKNNNKVDGIRGSRSKRVKHANTLAVLIAMTTTGACVLLKIKHYISICIMIIDNRERIRPIHNTRSCHF